MAASTPEPAARGPRLRFESGALHVAGLLASSWLLERAIRHLPGFEASRLADALATASAARTETSASGRAHLVLHDAVLPATLEELLFRGLLYGVLRRAAGVPAAIAGSAILFGLAHLDLHHGLVAGLLGLQLGLLREREGLALAWLAHLTNNVLAASTAGSGSGWHTAAVALALCGLSNAVLLQASGSGARRRAERGGLASGDVRV